MWTGKAVNRWRFRGIGVDTRVAHAGGRLDQLMP